MNWKKNALVALAVTSLMGCGPTTTVDDPDDGETHSYVMTVADIPAAMDGSAPGFNLDGRNDPGMGEDCVSAATDYTSPNGATGVDNQFSGVLVTALGALLGGDTVGGLITEQINDGSLLLVMEVSDIDDMDDDASVFLRLYLGAVPGGGMPMLGGDGRLAADQDFDVEMEVTSGIAAEIDGGRLSVTLPTLPLTLAIGSDMGTLTLRQVRLEADISETTLTNGEIGAQVNVSDVVTLGEAIMPGVVTEALVRDFADPDLDPDPADNTVCNAISAGLTFGAVGTINN